MAGCDNEIDINAPWRETPVVYAFLDPNTGTQYLRIEKTYQNSVDLTTEEGAKINDSLYFDNIVVKVKKVNSDSIFIFTKTTDIPKETGFFSSGTHYLYKSSLYPQPSVNYTLEIYSPKTQNTYLSTTTAIGKSNLIANTFRFSPKEASLTLTLTPISGAADIKPTLRFKYLEYSTSIANSDTFFVDYVVDENVSMNGSNLRYNINNRVFVNYIKDIINVKSGYTRKIVGFDLFFIGAGKEIIDLINVMKPSSMVVQKKLEYSNISGGLGIFSSRSVNEFTNIQDRIGSNWGNAAGKAEMINLLNGIGEGINSKNLNFIP
jgi:hypothetical protein